MRRAHFESVDSLHPEKLFVRDDPSHRGRREETKLFTGSKVLRAIVTEVALDQIPVIIRIGNTPRKTEAARRNVTARIASREGNGLALVGDQHSRNIVSAECVCIVDLHLGILSAVCIRRASIGQRPLLAIDRAVLILTGNGVYALITLHFKSLGAAVVRTCKAVVGEETAYRKPLQQKGEVPRQPQIGLQGNQIAGGITRLRGTAPRVPPYVGLRTARRSVGIEFRIVNRRNNIQRFENITGRCSGAVSVLNNGPQPQRHGQTLG